MTPLPPADSDTTPHSSGISGRSVLIGLALVVLVNIWVPYGSFLVHSSRMTMSHLPIAVMIPFLLLLLVVNPFLRTQDRFTVLNGGELALIFAMLFVATLVPGKVMAAYLFGVMATPYYYATTENQWAITFFEYLPSWLLVGNQGNALVWFYEGLPPGARDIPWSPWVVPLPPDICGRQPCGPMSSSPRLCCSVCSICCRRDERSCATFRSWDVSSTSRSAGVSPQWRRPKYH